MRAVPTRPDAPASGLDDRGRRRRRIAAFALWGLLLMGYVAYARARTLTPLDAVRALLSYFADGAWGPAFYVAAYAARPLLLFPATLITVAGGVVFGPLWGAVWVVAASNLSAAIAYGVGRFFTRDATLAGATGAWIDRHAERLRRDSFEAVLLMRFIFLPYDLVSYMAGFLRIRFAPFLLATALGSLPATLAFVWFGASIRSLDEGLPRLDTRTLAASAMLFVASFAMARWLKLREKPAA